MKKHLISYSLVFLALQPALGMAMDAQQPGSSSNQSDSTQSSLSIRRRFPQPAELNATTMMQFEQDQIQKRLQLEETVKKFTAKNRTGSQLDLANMCRDGKGGDFDRPRARMLYYSVSNSPKSSPQERIQALRQLADMCANGQGGTKNPARAREMLEQIANDPATPADLLGDIFYQLNQLDLIGHNESDDASSPKKHCPSQLK